MSFYPKLELYIQGLLQETSLINYERKKKLADLAEYIQLKQLKERTAALNFICTHNSRRSHISQIWAATAAAHFRFKRIATFSGGTEATAFNPRAVAAMERAGFVIGKPEGTNPHYEVSFSSDSEPLVCYSKTFDDANNPKREFAAIMTCSEADANCPFIPGADWRLPLTYEDPKEADGTAQEALRYDERVRQIGREIFYAMKLI